MLEAIISAKSTTTAYRCFITICIISFLSFLDRKLDGEASEMVFWVCKQIEGAVMRSKNVANEQKTETLTLGLGREKRSEEILRYSRRDAMTIVGDSERSWRGDFKGDKSLCRTDTLHSILDDVDEHLLEQDGIEMNGYGFVGQTEVNMDVRLRTQVFEEGATGFHLLAEVAELQLRLRNLYYFGKAGDKGREGGEPLGLVACETTYDSRHAVIHLVGNHTDDALVGGFLGKAYF